jgi:hypothetical protein
MLQPFQRPVAVVQCSSSSGPFLADLSRTNRVVITGTRSGAEQNYARFGSYFAEAVGDLAADLDKDGQVSLLEAFLYASRQVEAFYKTEGRLATEHALLDDNGDKLGSGATFFRGIRVVKQATAPDARTPREINGGLSVDGIRAHQFHLVESEFERGLPAELKARRNRLELDIEALREKKSGLPEAEYYQQLEKLALQLSHLYESLNSGANGGAP